MAARPSLNIITRQDVLRAIRDMEDLENQITGAKVRGGDMSIVSIPPTIMSLQKENDLDIFHKDARQMIRRLLMRMRDDAPQVHISFAIEPDNSSLQEILKWFRKEINPELIFRVGIQPSIAVGCVIRTTNHYFDFSLRQVLQKKGPEFIKRLEGIA